MLSLSMSYFGGKDASRLPSTRELKESLEQYRDIVGAASPEHILLAMDLASTFEKKQEDAEAERYRNIVLESVHEKYGYQTAHSAYAAS